MQHSLWDCGTDVVKIINLTISEQIKKTGSTTNAASHSFLEDDTGEKTTGKTSAKERENLSADKRDY